MTKFTPVKTVSTRPSFRSQTPSATGAFDTSARLDVQAAVFRNRTWVTSGTLSPPSDRDYAAPAEAAPQPWPAGVDPEEKADG